MRFHRLLTIAAAALLLGNHAAIDPPQVPDTSALTYADLADMALAASVVAGVQVRKTSKLKGEAAAGVQPDRVRFYVQADVKTLIRGTDGLPARVSWLVDMQRDAANRPPKFGKGLLLLLASRVSGKPGELRLVAPRAQLAWTPDIEKRIRAILVAAASPDAPPRITGVARAFHVPGSLPGESETQIFLTTGDGSPISLAILRRPGEAPRWAVALGEMVDDSAAPPARDSLLWYRLACFLPPALPDTSAGEMNAEDAAAAAEDYRLVIEGLGPCERKMPR